MLAFTHAGYVAAGWGIALVVLAGYALRTVRRGKALAQRVPPEDRRWT
jgi:heme exporter protein D